MKLPRLSDVETMTKEEIEALAKKLDLALPRETYQATANRLYRAGRQEQAYVYQRMVCRSRELFEEEQK